MQEYEYTVLEQYDIDVRSTRKIRGAVLCDTNRGFFLLKEAPEASERFLALCQLYEYLAQQEWCSVDSIVLNKEQQYTTSAENGNRYLLKKWFAGRECDVRKPGEILEGVGALAKLHMAMPRNEEWNVVKSEPLDKTYLRHNREMKKVRGFIRGISPKGNFEVAFLQCFENMFEWVRAAETLLDDFEYDKFYLNYGRNHFLVHGEYNYHNIIMENTEGKGSVIAITNFEKFKENVQVEDLYYFLRKVMEKYGWKERLGDNMLNAYSAVKPLTEEELEYIKIRLVYPEKFWKIANSYYHSNKAWISVKNVEKLEIAIRQTKEKERFLKNIFSFHL